jgi:hypothetical protein
MLIGDGDPSRKQRENLFSPDSKVMGAYSGPHRDLTLETCINFAGKFELKGGAGGIRNLNSPIGSEWYHKANIKLIATGTSQINKGVVKNARTCAKLCIDEWNVGGARCNSISYDLGNRNCFLNGANSQTAASFTAQDDYHFYQFVSYTELPAAGAQDPPACTHLSS